MKFLTIFLLPGLVFQGVIVAGGYATGQEIIQFFLINGIKEAFLGMLLVALFWGVGLAILFELCRKYRCYEYRSLLRLLNGRWWRINEVLLGLLALMVAAVVLATSAEVMQESFAMQRPIGMALLSIIIIAVVGIGSNGIKVFMSIWSILLYILFAIVVTQVFEHVSGQKYFDIINNRQQGDMQATWVLDAIAYAAYNLSSCIAIIYCLTNIEFRSHAILSGFFAGILGILPASMLMLAMLPFAPEIFNIQVPSLHILAVLNQPLLTLVFQIIFMGTLIQTGASIIFSINQGIYKNQIDVRSLSQYLQRAATASAILIIGGVIAWYVPLSDIIGIGYGIVGIGFMLFFVIPLFIVGTYKIWFSNVNPSIAEDTSCIRDAA